MEITELVKVAQALKEIKAAGMSIDDLKEASQFVKETNKKAKTKMLAVNGAPLDANLHMTRTDDDFIVFELKGYKKRSVSLDDLRAGLVALENNEFVLDEKGEMKKSKAGCRYVVRASTKGTEGEKMLSENLILAAKNAKFI